MTPLIIALGTGIGFGLWLIFTSFFDTPKRLRPKLHVSLPINWQSRLAQAAAAGFTLGIVTRWPVAVVAGGALGWFATDLLGSNSNRKREIERTEAIASWTEMLRDVISSAHGLEETIVTSAPVAPDPIRADVIRLATSLEYQPIDDCLNQFAADLAHPTGDLVVTALRLAANGSGRELGELLGTLAVAARDEAGMYLRVDAARARMRTAVRVITLCTVVTAVGLALFNRPYLRPYDGVEGQLVLCVIAVGWGVSLKWLTHMGNFAAPERFLITRGVQS